MAADWGAVVVVMVMIYESLSRPGAKGCQSVHHGRCQWQSLPPTVSLRNAVVADRRGKLRLKDIHALDLFLFGSRSWRAEIIIIPRYLP